MSCISCCFFKCFQLFIIYGYPGYKVIQSAQQKDLQKLWRDSTDRFIDVARGVPCLQKKCNN